MQSFLATAIFWICCIGFNAIILSLGLSYLQDMLIAIYSSMLPF